jgi:6-phosphogluconolactonase
MTLGRRHFGVNSRVFDNPEALFAALTDHIATVAAGAVADRGRFSMVITGGQTVVPLYGRLRHIGTSWSAWTVYWSDERCLPRDHEYRNSRQAHDAWLSHVPIPPGQIFPIPAELGPEMGAEQYARVLSEEGLFDLVLLSMGEDGHVASIFPGAQLEDPLASPVISVTDAPKSPSERVSLSLRRLAHSRNLVLLAVGETKGTAVGDLRRSGMQPASLLARVAALSVWMDQAANDAVKVKNAVA